tara:strand:- start:194 stop:970 length:777 start_codon:yes stop_codon:yes gene_type:complete
MSDIEHKYDGEIISLSDDQIFYTIEGEGQYVGQPSIFVRTSGCNLTCKGFISPDAPFGCDSYISWSKHNRRTFKEVWNEFFVEKDYVKYLRQGAILKFTGGEPLIHQEMFIKFLEYIEYKSMWSYIHVDFETNATIRPSADWSKFRSKVTFTTSPKLASNGDPLAKRYVSNTLEFHADNTFLSTFKFVVQNREDVDEIIRDYSEKFRISRDRIWLMPCCGSRKEQDEKAAQVVEWCKEFGFNYSPRLHLQVWDQALKV